MFVPRCAHCKDTLHGGSDICPHCGTAAPRTTPKQMLTAGIALAIVAIVIYLFDALKP